MPGLILKGNLTRKLGSFFPSPYIEKIIIEPDSIEVRASIMLTSDETEYFDELIEQLQDELYVYVALMYDGTVSEQLKSKSISIFDPTAVKYQLNFGASSTVEYTSGATAPGTVSREILDIERPGKDTGHWAGTLAPGGMVRVLPEEAEEEEEEAPETETIIETEVSVDPTYNLIQIPFSRFVKSEEEIRSEDGGLIVKYNLTDNFVFDNIEAFIQGVEHVEVFSFTSVLDYDSINEDGTWPLFAAAGSEPSPELTEDLSNLTLLQRSISDLSYEPLMIDGSVVPGTEIAYIDHAGDVYPDIPFKSLAGTFHKSEITSHDDLIESFRALIESGRNDTTEASEDETLMAALDSISYVVETYGYYVDILLRLNDLRRTFPEKGQATTTGKLYNALSNKLAALNRTILSEDGLSKRQIRNSKIIDNTESYEVLEGWQEYDHSDYDTSGGQYDDGFIYPDLYMTRYGVWENSPTVDDDGVTEDEPAIVLNSGYFFFDYEKVMRTQTNISKVFNLVTFEKFFGTNMTNSCLKLEYLEFDRWLGNPEYGIPYMLAHKQINFNQLSNYPEIENEVVEASLDPQSANPVVLNSVDTYSYVVPRSFNVASSAGLLNSTLEHDYRLMGVEFEDYYDIAQAETVGYYLAAIKVDDHTHKIVQHVVESFYDNLNIDTEASLINYYEAASEQCSYNDFQGLFNSFFADAMLSKYADNMANAPWIRAPIIYAVHNDMVLNTFNGNKDEILEFAKKMINNIAPDTGTLEQLQNFYEKYEQFWNDVYGSGDFADTVDDMDSETLYFNQLFDITGNLYYSAAYDEEMRLRSEWVEFLTEQYNLILEYLQAWANEYDDLGVLGTKQKYFRDVVYEWLYKQTDGALYTEPAGGTSTYKILENDMSTPEGWADGAIVTPFGFRYIQEVAYDSNMDWDTSAYNRDSANGIGQVLSDMKNLAGLDICEFLKILLGDYAVDPDSTDQGSYGDWSGSSGDDVYGNTREDRFKIMEDYFEEAGASTAICYGYLSETQDDLPEY